MRYFQVPEPIQITIATGLPEPKTELMPFHRYATACWLDDPRAIRGSFEKQVRWAKVLDQFAKTTPGQWIALEDADYAVLREIVNAPDMSFAPTVTIQCIAFSRAVLEAVEQMPVTHSTNGATAEHIES